MFSPIFFLLESQPYFRSFRKKFLNQNGFDFLHHPDLPSRQDLLPSCGLSVGSFQLSTPLGFALAARSCPTRGHALLRAAHIWWPCEARHKGPAPSAQPGGLWCSVCSRAPSRAGQAFDGPALQLDSSLGTVLLPPPFRRC